MSHKTLIAQCSPSKIYRLNWLLDVTAILIAAKCKKDYSNLIVVQRGVGNFFAQHG